MNTRKIYVLILKTKGDEGARLEFPAVPWADEWLTIEQIISVVLYDDEALPVELRLAFDLINSWRGNNELIMAVRE